MNTIHAPKTISLSERVGQALAKLAATEGRSPNNMGNLLLARYFKLPDSAVMPPKQPRAKRTRPQTNANH